MRRALPFVLLLTACSTLRPIPAAWRLEPVSPRIRNVILDENGTVSIAPLLPLAAGPVSVENNRLVRDGKRITEQFAEIESFGYSESRDEVIFSARRDRGFDIGLAAGDGSKTNWAPADPADEVMVQWAPRGYKASYVVRALLGDVVRSLHIPTSFQYAIDFGPATIYDVAWENTGEKYAVAFSTIDASDRVEVLRFDGRDRVVAIPPATKITADVVSFAPGAYVLRPPGLQYNEKLPVVVWVVDRFEWSDARAMLMREARVAIVITRNAGDELRKAIAETPWLDATRVYGVNAKMGTSVIADASVPPDRYRRDGDLIAVAPNAVQSFAAGFIADQLKRTTRTNGSSR